MKKKLSNSWKMWLVLLGVVVILVAGYWWLENEVNPPKSRIYDSQEQCEKKTRGQCAEEICDLTITTPTMQETCARDSQRGWVFNGEKKN